jgi:hypothetical protein
MSGAKHRQKGDRIERNGAGFVQLRWLGEYGALMLRRGERWTDGGGQP